MGDSDRNEWWRQKRWLIPLPVLVLLVIVDLVAAFGFTSDKDLRGSILGLLTPVVALIAGGAALLNFQETRRQNQRTYETTQRQLEEAQRQNERSFETSVHQLELAREQFAESQARSREQLKLLERGQVTERFSKAIEQLGQSEALKLDVRIGAIYALEQIARDSEDLHWPIVEILTAFIREHTKTNAEAKPASEQTEPDQEDAATRKVAADIQAALTVLSRRNWRSESTGLYVDLVRANLQGADLAGAHLREAKLVRANLQGAYLVGTYLHGANLELANLQGADLGLAHLEVAGLQGTNLEGANLLGANLQRAMLGGANLQGAKLHYANLEGATLTYGWSWDRASRAQYPPANLGGADFQSTHLGGANLRGVDLSGTVGLVQEQLDSANCDEKTKPPPGLTINVRPDVELAFDERDADQSEQL